MANWIAAAVSKPGAFAQKADKAAQSTMGYARQVTKDSSRASTTTKRQANLALTLNKLRVKKGYK